MAAARRQAREVDPPMKRRRSPSPTCPARAPAPHAATVRGCMKRSPPGVRSIHRIVVSATGLAATLLACGCGGRVGTSSSSPILCDPNERTGSYTVTATITETNCSASTYLVASQSRYHQAAAPPLVLPYVPPVPSSACNEVESTISTDRCETEQHLVCNHPIGDLRVTVTQTGDDSSRLEGTAIGSITQAATQCRVTWNLLYERQ